MATADARRLPLSRELIALGRTLARPGALLAVVALSLLVVALAYQVRPGYALQAGSKTDAPFWQHVNDGEQEPATKATYRWTTGESTLVLPGVGAGAYTVQLDLSGSRPPGFPAPVVDVLAGGQVLATLQPAPARQLYPVDVPAAAVDSQTGDLRVTLRTRDPFSPPGDARQLGVVVFGVRVDPAGSGPVAPPLPVWLGLAAAAGLLVLLLGTAGWGPAVVFGAGAVWTAGAAAFLLWNRLWLTPLSGILWPVLLAALGLLLVLGPLGRRLLCAGGITWPVADQRWLLAIYGLAFVARLAGQLHPQAVVIDLVFHQHRFEQVLAGQLLFTIQSDEWAGHSTFYLPTAYVFMLPLQWLLQNELLTIRAFTVGLDTLNIFLVYYLARRAFGDGRAGLLAAGLQVTFPLAVLPFSWGITTNLFGQFTTLAALAVLVGCYERLTRPGPWLVLVAVLTAALLSHPGSVQLAGMTVGGAIVVWGLVTWWGRRRARPALGPRRAWLALLGALGVAVALAWLGYYAHFAAFEIEQYQALQQERAAAAATHGFSAQVGGEVADASIGLFQRIVHDRRTWLIEGLQGFGAEAWAYFRAWPLLWAVLGFYVARRGGEPVRRRMLWLVAVVAAVVLLYAAVGLIANLYVRYALFALPFVALGCGLLFSALVRRAPWGRWLVTAVMLAFTVNALVFWYMRITFANK